MRKTCGASLRDGSRCRTFARESGFCDFHEQNAGDLAEQASTLAATVETEKGSEEVETEPEETTEPEEVAPTAKETRRVPVNVRAQLAEDAARAYDLMLSSLIEALDAEKTTFHTCSKCSKRDPVQMPDATARVKAVETLLNQGFGRPREVPKPNASEAVDKVLSEVLYFLTTDELETVLARMDEALPEFADELRLAAEAS